ARQQRVLRRTDLQRAHRGRRAYRRLQRRPRRRRDVRPRRSVRPHRVSGRSRLAAGGRLREAPMSAATPSAITSRNLALASRALYDRNVRLVGWGMGSVFDYFHRLFPLRLEYLVDSDSTKWGQRRGGFDVVSPERLARDAG